MTGAGSGVGVITQAMGCIDSSISCCQTWEKIIMSDVFTTLYSCAIDASVAPRRLQTLNRPLGPVSAA